MRVTVKRANGINVVWHFERGFGCTRAYHASGRTSGYSF